MEPNIVYVKFLESMESLMPDAYWKKRLDEIISKFKEISYENENLKKELESLKKKTTDEVKMWGEK